MKTPGTLSICTALLLLQACSHPIEIEGEGDVTSASGTRNCLLEDFQAGLDNCSKNHVIGAYEETYYATARPGWFFDHWATYCQNAAAPNYDCTFNVPEATVQQFWGQTMPPLRAVFKAGVPLSTARCHRPDREGQLGHRRGLCLGLLPQRGLPLLVQRVPDLHPRTEGGLVELGHRAAVGEDARRRRRLLRQHRRRQAQHAAHGTGEPLRAARPQP